ncbi:DUF4097 family beta strand repeat-containing protein [Nitriliruptor alkaliphilus]|uniref:DUF4097 family beta strand repeat-containing protein n=1 Tax=Nitriliruptor alkaliphilus TaxID=427918 RepID=UPI0006962F5B|nr:DUF4097 family beta strand repeat-containing protein [Nitriliruptor alkaliphilus]
MTTELRRPATEPAERRPAPSVGAASRRLASMLLGSTLIVAGLLLAGFLWSDTLVHVDESTTTHDAVPRVVLDLTADGNVEVRVHDADEIVVEQRIERTIGGVDASQEVVDDALELRSQRCGWVSGPLIRCSVSFVVTVPSTTSVVGELRHGSIALIGLEGDADLRTGHGNIDATDVGGPLTLRSRHGGVAVAGAQDALLVETSHGSVTVTDVVGPTDVSSRHGSLVIDGAAGHLTAGTQHGSIEATRTTGDVIALSSRHGSIHLRPTVAPTTAEVSTSHGDITVVLPADAPPYAITTNGGDRAADLAVATDPGADRRLDLRTRQGRIEVRYAAS